LSEGKRYYWLKLKDDFFQSKRIKKLRNMAGGDTYTVIYLKMQLLALRTDGVLRWSGLEDNFAQELALDLDEKPEDVEVTLMYLLNVGLAETNDNISFFLPWVLENTGSETAATLRSRDYRARQKMLQCNTDATLMQRTCNTSATQVQHVRDVESEKEIEKEIDIESESDKRPTLQQVKDYASEIGSIVEPERFYNFYAEKGWKTGNEPINDWKAIFRKWSADERPKKMYKVDPPKKIDPDALRKIQEVFGNGE